MMAHINVKHYINGEVRAYSRQCKRFHVVFDGKLTNGVQFVSSSDGATFDLFSPYNNDLVAKGTYLSTYPPWPCHGQSKILAETSC